jgi:aspartyl-tRNA(Asn)/glutamyl-tRNA(Gln) amidotransferase subunit A
MIDAAMRGLAPKPPEPGEVPRILVPTNIVLDDCEPEVIANFEASLAALASAGAVVERRPFPFFDEIAALHTRHGAIVAHEAYALHRERLAGPKAALIDRRVVARLSATASLDPAGLAALLAARRDLIARAAFAMGDSLVAYPTVAHVAPEIAALEADDELFTRVNFKTLRNTALGNMLGWPGVSLPNGFGRDAAPTGFLLSAPPSHDERLLAAALTVERLFAGAAPKEPLT